MIYYFSDNPNGFVTGKQFSIDKPCVTIMANGMGGDSYGHWHLADDGIPMTTTNHKLKKPPYQVPSMDEVRAIPWNGLTVASTFSGTGGSCLGYRMAGYRVVWANEFVPIAQESYLANASDHCYLDKRDIAMVRPEEVLEQTGLAKGELDLFDGSPPCQAFSTAGKREKGWGKDKGYEHGAKQKNETLFDEYVRLLRGIKPKVFVAENVSGLIKGTAKGYFLEILAALKASGYRVTCRVLDAQWLGVPQQRQRTIFVGVREDLGMEPVHPKPLAYRYSVRDALPWISHAGYYRGESIPGSDWQPYNKTYNVNKDPFGTIPATCESEKFQVSEGNITEIQNCPIGMVESETDISRFAIGTKWDKMSIGSNLGMVEVQSGAFPKKYSDADGPSPAVMAGRTTEMRSGTERRKFTIQELRRICAFPDDFVLKGSYAKQWERLGNSVPPVMMKHIAETIRDKVFGSRLTPE